MSLPIADQAFPAVSDFAAPTIAASAAVLSSIVGVALLWGGSDACGRPSQGPAGAVGRISGSA